MQSIYLTSFEQYEDSETFKKIPKSPKPQEDFNAKGKKRNKKDYSKERSKKRDYD